MDLPVFVNDGRADDAAARGVVVSVPDADVPFGLALRDGAEAKAGGQFCPPPSTAVTAGLGRPSSSLQEAQATQPRSRIVPSRQSVGPAHVQPEPSGQSEHSVTLAPQSVAAPVRRDATAHSPARGACSPGTAPAASPRTPGTSP